MARERGREREPYLARARTNRVFAAAMRGLLNNQPTKYLTASIVHCCHFGNTHYSCMHAHWPCVAIQTQHSTACAQRSAVYS
eukprot:14159-Heterococcus_DN1.PRE.2